jgi:voltage-gated potassium channel
MTAQAAASEAPRTVEHGNAYNIFILVLTIFSLIIMALMILPLDENTISLLTVYDNAICIIFLIDFTINIRGSHPRNAYFVGKRGWLDLLGSIPSFGFFRFTVLLRLFRLSRLARVSRLMRGKNKEALIKDVVENRGQYAAFITILAAGLVLAVASILMIQFEDRSPNANITTGGDSLWWAIVTITTVGYGDKYPVTTLGRLTATLVMFAGVGIIGALASILASILVPSAKPKTDEEVAVDAASDAADAATASSIATELANIRAELVALRATIVAADADPPPAG